MLFNINYNTIDGNCQMLEIICKALDELRRMCYNKLAENAIRPNWYTQKQRPAKCTLRGVLFSSLPVIFAVKQVTLLLKNIYKNA